MDKDLAKVLNSFFKAIYVISLPRFTTRHKAIEAECCSLNYHLFYGWDREQINVEDLESEDLYAPQLAKSIGRPMRVEEVAVAFSHKNLYKHALQKNQFPILVLEDDIGISPSASYEKVKASLRELPQDWDLCYLGYEKHDNLKVWPIYSLLLFFERIVYFVYRGLFVLMSLLGRRIGFFARPVQKYPRPFARHISRAGVHIGAHAYALSALGCRRLHEKLTPVYMPSDHALDSVCCDAKSKAFVFKQKVFINKSIQGIMPSTIKVWKRPPQVTSATT